MIYTESPRALARTADSKPVGPPPTMTRSTSNDDDLFSIVN